MSSTTKSLLAWLKTKHIVVPEDWVTACLEWLQSENPNVRDSLAIRNMVYDQWLLTDLRDFGQECLPSEIRNNVYTLKGNYTVQVENVIDVSLPKYSQLLQRQNKENSNMFVCTETQATQKPWEAKPSRMLMLSITDGVQEISAMEYNQIPKISEKMPPGTKITIKGPVICRRGVIMLKQSNVEVLGGEVEDLFHANNYEAVLCRGLNRPIPANPTPQVNTTNTVNGQQNHKNLNRTSNLSNNDRHRPLSENRIQNRTTNAVSHGQRANTNNSVSNRKPNTTNSRQNNFKNENLVTKVDDFDDDDLDQIMADADFDDTMDDAVLSSLVTSHSINKSSVNQNQKPKMRMISDDLDDSMDDAVLSSLVPDTLETRNNCSNIQNSYPSSISSNKSNTGQTVTIIEKNKCSQSGQLDSKTNSFSIKTSTNQNFDTIMISDDEEIDELLADPDLDERLSSQPAEVVHPNGQDFDNKRNSSTNLFNLNIKGSNSLVSKSLKNNILQKPMMKKDSGITKLSSNNCIQPDPSGSFPQLSEPCKQEYKSTQPKLSQKHTQEFESKYIPSEVEDMDIFEDDIPIFNSRKGTVNKRQEFNSNTKSQYDPQCSSKPILSSKPCDRSERDSTIALTGKNIKENGTLIAQDSACISNSVFKTENRDEGMYYICQAKKFLLKYQGRKEINIRIKGLVVTLLSKLKSDETIGWGLKARICDGTETLDAEFSNGVLTKLIGFNVPEAEAIKLSQNSVQREKLKAGMQCCRESIISMCHFMNVKIIKTATSSIESFITNIEF